MAIPDRLENKAAIEAAKAEILAALTEQGNVIAGCVKSIQRGEANLDNSSEVTWRYIDISPVDTNKAVLLLQYEGDYPSNMEYRFSLESNRIVFYSSLGKKFRFLWQVVEFY